jgi:hypothetical protein
LDANAVYDEKEDAMAEEFKDKGNEYFKCKQNKIKSFRKPI